MQNKPKFRVGDLVSYRIDSYVEKPSISRLEESISSIASHITDERLREMRKQIKNGIFTIKVVQYDSYDERYKYFLFDYCGFGSTDVTKNGSWIVDERNIELASKVKQYKLCTHINDLTV